MHTVKQVSSGILFLIVITFLKSSCGTTSEEKVSSWPHAVNYEIFVRSFCDSSGDGIGDFRGMTSRLDHLTELGVEGIWLMPIHPSSSYHKYNVEDYFDVHPDHGTLDDFREFVSEAHRRNIRVVIDMVINHSGNGNPWFADVVDNGKQSPYWDYYVWARNDTLQAYVDAVISDYPEYGRRRRWHQLSGTDYLFYSYFGRNMPQLNYDNPVVREEVFRIGRFWLSEIGVDGFRLDAARHIYPEYRAGDIHEFWEEYRNEMLMVNEDVYLLGEVWASVGEVAPFLTGLPALFNFDLSEAIQKAVTQEDEGGLVKDQMEVLNTYRSINPDFIDATFITNHDQNRIMSVVEGDENKARMAAALLLTLPGSPYIYYGEEIGMLGMKPDPNIREPFLWDARDSDECRTTWREIHYNTDEAVTPLAIQREDESSLYNYYREYIHLRNHSLALTYGDLQAVNHNNEGVVVFIREHVDESLMVIHNISAQPKTFEMGREHRRFRKVGFSANNSGKRGSTIDLPPYSSIILTKRP
jgi:alpha-amylase